jgi:hypothetical protein
LLPPVFPPPRNKNPTISGRVNMSTVNLDTLGIVQDCKEIAATLISRK